jgi:hypothetical protein
LREEQVRATVEAMKSSSAATTPRPRQAARESEYDRDFYAWIQSQVQALRARRFDALDAENLAEEVEDVGRSLRRELTSRLRVTIAHLLKCQYEPEKRSDSWQSTLDEQRWNAREILQESPSLRPQLHEILGTAYKSACLLAAREMGLTKLQRQRTFPSECPWSIEQLLDDDFLPKASRSKSA